MFARVRARRSRAIAVRVAASLAALSMPLAGALSAQAPQRGVLTGVVRDLGDSPIAGVAVSIVGTSLRAETDAEGRFRIAGVEQGEITVSTRRLGFQPTSLQVRVPEAEGGSITLLVERNAQELAPVVVQAGRREYTGRMAGFLQRKDRGQGHFITRDQLDRAGYSQLTDHMRRIPGVRVLSTRSATHTVRFRGASCAPLVWIDGAPASAGEFDLASLAPHTLEGVEVYSGTSTVPPQFMWMNGLGSCGVIAVWTRAGEPRPKKRSGATAAQTIAMLVETVRVYTAEQVQTPARPDSTRLVRPVYPDSLQSAGVGGAVIAEFVVDASGEAELDNFNVVSSPHYLFSNAVREAVRESRFLPALREGRPVRMVMQLPFYFVPTQGAQPRTNP